MADRDSESGLVGEFLQLQLEEVHAISITPTPVGGGQELRGLRIRRAAHAQPPLTDAGDSKFCRVMVGADSDPARVADRIRDAVRNGFAEDRIGKVVGMLALIHFGMGLAKMAAI